MTTDTKKAYGAAVLNDGTVDDPNSLVNGSAVVSSTGTLEQLDFEIIDDTQKNQFPSLKATASNGDQVFITATRAEVRIVKA